MQICTNHSRWFLINFSLCWSKNLMVYQSKWHTKLSHQMNFIWKTQKGLGWNDYSWFGATYINRGLKREPKIKKPNLLEPLDLCMWRGVKDVVPTWCPLVIWICLLLKTKTKDRDWFQHSFLELMWSLNISHN